jgi:hypothetical protein
MGSVPFSFIAFSNFLATMIGIEAPMAVTTTMAIAGNINSNLLNETLCEEIVELKPSLFALVHGCRAVRVKYKFLSISDLVEEIENAKHNARRYGYALEEFGLPEFEAELLERTREFEAKAPERKADRKRAKLAHPWTRKSKHELVPEGLAVEDENDGESNADGAGK